MKANNTYAGLAGKLYYYYYVQCALCQSEWTLGVQNRTQAIDRLKTGGWKITKQGYICRDCHNKQKSK